MRKFCCPTVVGIILYLMTTAVHAATLKPFVVGAVNYVNPDAHSYERWLLAEALLLHGYEIEVRYFPGKRLMVELNNGNLDADMSRTLDLSRGFSQIVQVEAPLIQACAWIYQLSQGPTPSGGGRFGLFRGAPGGHALAAQIMPDVELVFFSSLNQAAKMLAGERIDYIGLVSWQVEPFEALMTRPIKPYLQLVLPFSFAHFHRRHAKLAQEIRATILTLQQQRPMPLCQLEARFMPAQSR